MMTHAHRSIEDKTEEDYERENPFAGKIRIGDCIPTEKFGVGVVVKLELVDEYPEGDEEVHPRYAPVKRKLDIKENGDYPVLLVTLDCVELYEGDGDSVHHVVSATKLMGEVGIDYDEFGKAKIRADAGISSLETDRKPEEVNPRISINIPAQNSEITVSDARDLALLLKENKENAGLHALLGDKVDCPEDVEEISLALQRSVDAWEYHTQVLEQVEELEPDREAFNQAVIDELVMRGREEVAQMSEEMDEGMSSLPSFELARDSGYEANEIRPDNKEVVEEIVDARIVWFERHG